MRICRSILLSLFLLCSCVASFAQPMGFVWAKTAMASASNAGQYICTDPAGNIIISGYFTDSVSFGSTTLACAVPDGSNHVFIVKYDPSGNLLWAKSSGGSGYEQPRSIASDKNGNICLSGLFYGSTVSFGMITLNNTDTTSSPDIFIARYDPAGNPTWALSIGDSLNDYGGGICTDSLGNIYTSGSFGSAQIILGNDTLVNTPGPSGFRDDIFIAKYDSLGNELWAKRAGGSDYDESFSIATDKDNNIFTAGSFWSASFLFGADTLVNATPSISNAFFCKYDPNGNELWARSAGGAGSSVVAQFCADSSGNVIITGTFQGPSIAFGSITLSNSGISAYFVAKYDPSGNPLWAKTIGGSYNNYGHGAVVDPAGNIYTVGSFYGTVNTFDSDTLNIIGDNDAFVAKYDPSGNVLWARGAGGLYNDHAYSVAISGGDPVLTGYIRGPSAYFGATVVSSGNAVLNTFLAKIGDVTGTEDPISPSGGVLFYPNPFSDAATVVLSGFSRGSHLFILSDLTGREVFRKELYSDSEEIRRGGLSPGMYLYTISKAGEKICSGKIIVQ